MSLFTRFRHVPTEEQPTEDPPDHRAATVDDPASGAETVEDPTAGEQATGEQATGKGPAGEAAAEQQPASADDPTPAVRPVEIPGDHGAGDHGAGDAAEVARRPIARRIAARVLTALAALLVLSALTAPNKLDELTPGNLLRVPVEALLGIVLVLALRPKPRRLAAVAGGVLLGLLGILKMLDMGFHAVLARQFDPVLDWILIDDAMSFLTDSVGRAGAIGVAVVAVLLVVAVLVLMTLSVLRLSGLLVRHRAVAGRALAALAAVWVACAVLGVQIVPGIPVAARNTAGLAHARVHQVGAGLRNQQEFARQVGVDAFRDVPGDQLLTGLRGKDVILAFVESYGRDAVEDPELAPPVSAVLDGGTRRLGAAGFSARSAFLTSPTTGSGSWLAHSTLLSGLWIDNHQRYRNIVVSDRLTLTGAFARANWRTVGIMPGVTRAWPEGQLYDYQRIYDSRQLGYHGPKFSWATMPDQFALAAFEGYEHAKPNSAPLMAVITLVSSHAPWSPIPEYVDWDDLGDGSVFADMARNAEPKSSLWQDPARVRTQYRRSIEYSLTSVISYVETYGDDDTVVVIVGDHQPSPIVTGTGASRDVPITIVAHDRAVLDRISRWGWQDGLKPGPRAPVWRMDSFRDRFLTAFGPRAGSAR